MKNKSRINFKLMRLIKILFKNLEEVPEEHLSE